jgi:glycosyltransferase involved in cell wall biosynthesis
MNKKVLLIAYHFPPDASVGAIRPAKFAKYLERFGWDVIALTIRREHIPATDAGRMRDVQHIPIERTRVWPSISQLTLKARDALIRQLSASRSSPRPESASDLNDTCSPGGPGRTRKLLAKHFDAFFEIPDKQVGWLAPAVLKACRLVRRHGIQSILASSPPRTAALVGTVVSHLTGARLFTDLRDPFFRPTGDRDPFLTPLARRIIGWMETQVMQRSTRVITTTEKYCSFLQQHYSHLPAGRFCNIWNGFDAEDLRSLSPAPKTPKFRIAYFGTFYFGRNPAMLLKALGEMLREGKLRRSDLEVRFIGEVAHAEGSSVSGLIHAEGLTDCVSLDGFIPYQEALRAMRQSDVLLLYAPDQYYCIPTKAFDYLGIQGKILCISKEGATADLVRETGSGVVVAPGDFLGLKTAILQFYDEFRQGRRNLPNRDFSRFERKNLAMQLDLLLSEPSGGGPCGSPRGGSGGPV